MKLILFILFTSLLSCNVEQVNNLEQVNTKPQKTCYYFCTSRTVKQAQNVSKDLFLYTDIYSILENEATIKSKSSDWKNIVDQNCISKCTSDLNYYSSYEQAHQTLMQWIEIYKNNSKYELRKVEFLN
jgi:hypothetical protein